MVSGAGRLQTLGPDGYAETPLRPGDCLWFTPGTIHRLVNDGDLRLAVVMQNAGLPEHGDAVLTFPPDILADPDAYARAASLDVRGGSAAEAARRRRDLAIEGYLALRDQVAEDGPGGAGPVLCRRAEADRRARRRLAGALARRARWRRRSSPASTWTESPPDDGGAPRVRQAVADRALGRSARLRHVRPAHDVPSRPGGPYRLRSGNPGLRRSACAARATAGLASGSIGTPPRVSRQTCFATFATPTAF